MTTSSGVVIRRRNEHLRSNRWFGKFYQPSLLASLVGFVMSAVEISGFESGSDLVGDGNGVLCRLVLPPFLKLLFRSVRISQQRIPHGSGSWRVCIPLSASAHANLRPREVCVRA